MTAAQGITTLGRWGRERIEGLGRSGRFVGDTVVAARDVATWWPEASCMREPSASLVADRALHRAFTGIVLSLLASYRFRRRSTAYVGTLVEKTITMELAPVLTGLALAGRVGANIAAELGTMRVTEQVDALETLAYDPYAYLVVPRVLAGTIMFPIVVGLAMVVGIAAGWAASILLLGITSGEFVKGLRLFFTAFDVRYGLVKAASFGTAVTWIGCMQGLGARGGRRRRTGGDECGRLLGRDDPRTDAFWAVVWLLGSNA
jgi:phospholipid/cholesterol/gamma-HCH transport system permease protein